VASATKTYSGDLSTAIVGKISDAIDNYRQVKEIEKSKASLEVKNAARKLLSKDTDDSVSTTKDTDLKSYISKVFGTELDSSILQTEGKVGKLSDQILFIGEGIVNTQKLVLNQNELMESKFDELLSLFQDREQREVDNIKRLDVEEEELGMELRNEDFGSKKAANTFGGDLSQAGLGAAFRLFGLGFKVLSGGGSIGLKFGASRALKKTARNTALKVATNRLTTEAVFGAGRKITKNVAKEAVTKKAVSRGGMGILGRLFSSKAIVDALANKLGSKAVGKLSMKVAGKTVPVVQTGYGLVEGIARLAMGDPKGFFLSMGGAIPIGGYAFTILDVFRDIDRAAYNKHIEPNLRILGVGGVGLPTKLPSDKNISDYVSDALGVSPDQYETGTRLQPSFMNNFFERSVVSSAALIASAAGVAPEVNAEIRSSGLGHIPVENLNIRPDIGNISKAFSNNTISRSNLVSEVIPSLPPLPGEPDPVDPVKEPWRIFGIPLPDFGITEFIGGTVSAVRDIVWGRKDDGYWGPKWLGWKRKPKEVEPKTTITGQITDLEELAFLKLIRHVESKGPDSYNRWFGDRTDMDMTSMTLQEVYDEQTRRLESGEATYGDLTSAAVGIGQFMNPLEQAREMYAAQGKEFDPNEITFNKELQLQLMMDLAKRKRGIDVSEPLTLEGIGELNKEWSGLGPFYGQTNRSLQDSLNLYNKFLEELKFTPIQDRKISQLNSTSFETEDILDSSGGISPVIIMNNNTYVRNNDSPLGGGIPRDNNDWANKYKLYSLAG
tara:strand:+ start:716 stop:3055 length:2340 start_codon:yes stop_codon:yes gene_type:complete